jgi:3-deoxy-D-manno-octulosonic-acid transferase
MSLALRVYRGLWGTATVLGIPRLFLRERPRELAERSGRCPLGGRPRPLWIHAASVGETAAAQALVARLRREEGPLRLAVSAMTRTGVARGEALRPDVGPFHAPLDAPGPVRECLSRLEPRALVVLETELWPTLLSELNERSLPWGIVSARISERGVRRMRWVPGLYRELLATVAAVGARSEEDASRFVALGAPAAAVRVTGDLKSDRGAPPYEAPPPGSRRWIAACTRPGEEEIVLEALSLLAHERERGELLLAPRHPERFAAVGELVRARGWSVRSWAARDEAGGDGWSVVLVDEMGVLEEAYRRVDCAFVGGSLVPLGGHSPLEAAAAGRPVLLGPHTDNCRQAAADLEAVRSAHRVDGAAALAREVARLLDDPAAREREGRAALGVVSRGSGATAATVELLRERGLLR